MKYLYIIILSVFTSLSVNAQVCSNSVSSNDGAASGVSITKCLMSTYISPTGTNIQYEINFSTQGSVGTIEIEDVLDPNLTFVSSSGSFLGQPTVTIIGGIETLKWSGIAPAGTSGVAYNIRLTLKFKPQITCNGYIAPNQVSIKGTNIPKVTTDTVNVEAQAIDDWSITKTATRPGKTYAPGEIVEFDIAINGGGSIGRHNLTNVTIQDILPGSIIVYSSGDCFSSLNGNTISSNVTRCTIKVRYPASTFLAGSNPINTIKLTGTNPCGDIVTVTNTEQIHIRSGYVYVPPPLVAAADITKTVSISNPVPGCAGSYSMSLNNTGTKDIPDLTLTDVFPSSVTVNSIKFTNFGPSITSNTFEYSVDGGATWYGPISINNYNIPDTSSILPGVPFPAPPYSQIKIRAVTGGTILARSYLVITANFTVNAGVTVGQNISNTSVIASTSESILKQASAAFIIEEYQPKIKLVKSVCNNNFSYEPGDELVYRVEMKNSGSDAFVGGTFTDILDSKLQYLGDSFVKVYKTSGNAVPSCSSNGVLASGVIDLKSSSAINFNTAANSLNINLPTINANCSSNETLWVEFRVKIAPGVKQGRIPNKSTVSNSLLTKTSNTIYITVVEVYTLKIDKLISLDSGLTYTSGPVNVPAGAAVKYKIEINNVGNNSIQNINLIDMLPHNGDTNISLSNIPRGSNQTGVLLRPIIVPSGFQVLYSTNTCPDTSPELGSISCSGATPANWTPTFSMNAKSIKIVSNSYILTPTAVLTFILDLEVPPTAATGDMMCNNAHAIGKQLNGIDTQVFSSQTICLETIVSENIICCKTPNLAFNDKQGYDYLGEQYTRVHNIIELGGAPTLPLIPISEIRIAMSDIDVVYDYEDCAQCVNDPKLWGSLEGKTRYLGTGMSDKMLFLESNIGSGTFPQKDQGFRELIWSKWSGSAGRIIQSGDTLEFYTFLPPRSKIPCCATAIEVCYTISWKDANCNVCEVSLCKKITLQPLDKEN